MTSTSQSTGGAPGLWYSNMESRFDEEDAMRLTRAYDLPTDHELVLATPSDRPNDPPSGTVVFFRDQFLAGLRFPPHKFFLEVCNYFRIPLGQVVPNSIRLLSGVVVLFKLNGIPLTPKIFHYFYYPKQAEWGTFVFQSRIGFVLFDNMPSSNKHWKEHFFYIRFPERPTFRTKWQTAMPAQPELGKFRGDADYLHAAEQLVGQRYHIDKMLLPGVMHIFGLSSTPADLPCSMSKLPYLPLYFVLTDLFSASAAEVMWRARATEKLKLKAARIEAVTSKEAAEQGSCSG